MFGLSDEIIKKIREIEQSNDIEFFVFGSRARGDYKSNSDIDIAIKEVVDSNKKYKILNDIDMLDIVYKIDIVFVQDIKNKEFMESIEKDGKRI